VFLTELGQIGLEACLARRSSEHASAQDLPSPPDSGASTRLLGEEVRRTQDEAASPTAKAHEA
jgi:hypothetical protein